MPHEPAPSACVTPGCAQPAMQGRDHCPDHHTRRQETWRAARQDYRARQTRRVQELVAWARLTHDDLIPALAYAYDHNDAAMNAAEAFDQALVRTDTSAADEHWAAFADALNQSMAAIVDANRQIQMTRGLTAPLPDLIDPPDKRQQARAKRAGESDRLA